MYTGITSVAIDRGLDTVLVETTLPSEKVKSLIESVGRQAVIRGLGSSQGMSYFVKAFSSPLLEQLPHSFKYRWHKNAMPYQVHLNRTHSEIMVPTGSGKREGIFQSEKSRNFSQNTGKMRNLINHQSWGNVNVYWLFVHKYFLASVCLAYLLLLIQFKCHNYAK